ncbi:MAG: amino acid ABC transporter permease [Anaeromassilibacillus sp.]|jgi:amino ABC transporter, permease protein, 3-TM region, his/glu/gln/arg/opine family|uniref:Amino acid ABC transporter permease n=1 Tax=Bianquea renquensis TaxID=2763661 RepID=A0A926DVS2_9FIRM|nr:amino acid ABC transporter permease [Bianquea renquensis]MBC8544304.1 amino acid ABC transporter permease [Bianquea renquensis]
MIEWIQKTWQSFAESFVKNFIVEDRYMLIVRGLGTTILISLMAILLGCIIGFIMAFFRLSKIKLLNWIAGIYIDVIRGTPTVVQLLIIYYVIFAPFKNMPKVVIAAISFGINSGAYVAEIVRGGILSVDRGQMEAGRSLGLTSAQTMRLIIIPQAIKNILPALGNEFIVLIKETAIAGYIALQDLTKASDIIRSITWSSMPLFATAIIYFILVKLLSKGLQVFEKRLRKSEM